MLKEIERLKNEIEETTKRGKQQLEDLRKMLVDEKQEALRK